MTKIIDPKSHQILNSFAHTPQNTFQSLSKIITNSVTLSKRLNGLISLDLLTKSKRKYQLTQKGKSFVNYLNLAMKLINSKQNNVDPFNRIPNSTIIEVLRDYLSILKQYFGKNLLSVILFGSCARGDWNDNSDIDLLVIVHKWDIPTWERSRELIQLKKQLKSMSSFKTMWNLKQYFPITHYPLSDSSLKDFHPVLFDIVVEGIILYEKNNFAQNLISNIKAKLIEMNSVRITTPLLKRYWIYGK